MEQEKTTLPPKPKHCLNCGGFNTVVESFNITSHSFGVVCRDCMALISHLTKKRGECVTQYNRKLLSRQGLQWEPLERMGGECC